MNTVETATGQVMASAHAQYQIGVNVAAVMAMEDMGGRILAALKRLGETVVWQGFSYRFDGSSGHDVLKITANGIPSKDFWLRWKHNKPALKALGIYPKPIEEGAKEWQVHVTIPEREFHKLPMEFLEELEKYYMDDNPF